MKQVERFAITDEEVASTIGTSAVAFHEWLDEETARGGMASCAEGLGACVLAVDSLRAAIRLNDIEPGNARDEVRRTAIDLASVALWIVASLAREHRP